MGSGGPEATGALGSASPVAVEIAGDARQPQPAAAAPALCANCGAQLVGPYCHACGQRAHLHHSLLHWAEEVLHGVLHFDAKAWRTLPLLVVRPGLLTRRYIEGQRTRYVSPLAMFLFMTFLMFFAFSLTGEASGTLPAVDAARTATQAVEPAPPASPSSSARLVLNWPDTAKAVVKTGHPPLDDAIRAALRNPELALYKLKTAAYKFSFMLIPISLPFLWLMFAWRRDVTTYDHAVFSLYSLSFMALLFTVIALLSATALRTSAVDTLLLVPPVHMFWQLRETYRLRVWPALWRTLALLVVAGLVFLLFLAFIAVVSAS